MFFNCIIQFDHVDIISVNLIVIIKNNFLFKDISS